MKRDPLVEMPWGSRVKITDADGNVRYENALTYRARRDLGSHSRAKVSHSKKQKVRKRDLICQNCGTDKGPFHVDHIRPYSKGGWNNISNLQLLCAPCNRSKGAKWSPRSSG
jgi:5-methylcytosine-specific restriction endonuclease McrA